MVLLLQGCSRHFHVVVIFISLLYVLSDDGHPSIHASIPAAVYQGDHNKQWLKENIEPNCSKEMLFFRSRMKSIEVTWRQRVHKVCSCVRLCF